MVIHAVFKHHERKEQRIKGVITISSRTKLLSFVWRYAHAEPRTAVPISPWEGGGTERNPKDRPSGISKFVK